MSSFLSSLNIDYIEQLDAARKSNPESIDQTWRYFFEGLDYAAENGLHELAGSRADGLPDLEFELKVLRLIQAYRYLGYLIADVNPLDRGVKSHRLLSLEHFGLTAADLEKPAHVGKIVGLENGKLQEIIHSLTTSYCSPVALEYNHIDDPSPREWLQRQVESQKLLKPLPFEWKRRTLERLSEAECLETFLHRRFVGQKRFSVEGCDALIPMLDYLIDQAATIGTNEVIFGMGHRGRLNVLAHIFRKPLEALFAEFSGNVITDEDIAGDGDVKYHMGYSTDTKSFSGHPVHLSLLPNPSHLESINSVVLGVTRAKQSISGDQEKQQKLAVLLHGDAAFSGQGSVYEVLNMSELRGYSVGGAIHIVVDNQIGFTTDPKDSRSTAYATDIAKMLEVPIFRVNADEPEAALNAIELAIQYRHMYKRDVVIDLVGYRRYGHNEGDEPTFTQPKMYRKIASHPRVRAIYSGKLAREGTLSESDADAIFAHDLEFSEKALEASRQGAIDSKMNSFGKRWTGLKDVAGQEKQIVFQPVLSTAVLASELQTMGDQLLMLPEGFQAHRKIQNFLKERENMVRGERAIDWSLAESLAFASLLKEGYSVRLAGQDSLRGTFSHRHAVFFDAHSGDSFTPLQKMTSTDTSFEIVNSLLSEMAALGFEFGQSLADPKKLTLWEAQFGDFVNGAQVIIDQFITSSAVKWSRYSGLVLLLPHGHEGQGPEHSSARLDRFLHACAQTNIQVCNVTTSAQYFHLLRRQLHREFRLPLVLVTPKSLLRHPRVASSLEAFEKDCFHEVLDEPDALIRQKAKTLVFCSGKIFYELLAIREERGVEDVAIVRMEQFYPFDKAGLKKILGQYSGVARVVWCQEEAKNMGGWRFMFERLSPLLPDGKTLEYVGRPSQASPAAGYMHLHADEQREIVERSLGVVS